MNILRRKTAVGAAIGVAVLLAGYTAYWFVAAGVIREKVDEWAEARRAQGYEIAYRSSRVTGFPFRFETRIEDPVVTSVPDGWHWSGESLRISARPWNLRRLEFDFAGRHDVSLYSGTEWSDFAARVEEARGDAVLDDAGRIRAFELEITNLEYSRAGLDDAGHVGHLRVEGRRRDDAAADYRTPSADLTLSFEGLVVPQELSWVLNRHPLALSADASLTGPLPDGDAPTESFAAWRDAGGVLQVDHLSMRWGPIGIETDGTLALDSEMRPLGAFSADIIGYGDVIDLLAANKFVPVGDATLYKMGFDLLARPREEGGPPVLSVPITVQDGNLRMGPLKIGKIGPILPAPPRAQLGENS